MKQLGSIFPEQRAAEAPRLGWRRMAAVAVAGALLVAALCMSYARFVGDKVFEESVNHLNEVYTQVNATFTSLVSKNWNLLLGWAFHIEHFDEGDENRASGFLRQEQAKWGFTDFYFIDEDSNYLTLDGEEGYLDLGAQLPALMRDGRNVVVDGTLPASAELTLFAVPAAESTFCGFTYRALAVSYNNADMTTALGVSAFDGKSDCYVAYPDGRILLSAKDANRPRNFLAYLETNSTLTDDERERVVDDLAQGTSGVMRYQVDGVEHYLAYQPVGFQDWMLIGTVPEHVVNASISQIQWVTIAVIAAAFFVVTVVVLLLLLRRNRVRLSGKELEIKYREQLFGLLVSTSDDIFIMFSAADRTVEYVSPNVERLLGLPEEEVKRDIGVLGKTTVDGDDWDLSREFLDGLGADGSCRQERARTHQRTGERRWYRETLYRKSIDGVGKFFLVLADRTNEKRASTNLQQAVDIAHSANEAKSRFLANMSHDIRTPINAIVGMSAIARENAGDVGKVSECLDVVATSSKHLLSLINDVLDVSHIESGQTELQEGPCDVEDVVGGIVAIMQPQADAKRQELRVHFDGVVHKRVYADKLRLNQILLNLLSNAVKYTPEGGLISLNLEELAHERSNYVRLRLTVADNGVGMTPEFCEHVFEPFERDAQVAGRVQGTGLGMTIMKAQVDAMGGTVSVESAPGVGTTFVVVLDFKPAEDVDDEVAEADAGSCEDDAFDFAGKRFLLAEDNDVNALILEELLGMRGAEVDRACDGREAVALFERSEFGRYDAVLMDVMMPEMNGYEATAAIRGLPRDDAGGVRIVALTANAFATDVQAALDAGMDAHVPKPIDMDDLARTLRKLCGGN